MEILVKMKNSVLIPVDSNLSVIESQPALPEQSSTVIVLPAQKLRFKISHINEVNQTFINHDAGRQPAKNDYGFSLRKEVSLSSEDEKYQPVNYRVNKTKSIYGLLNSQ